MLVDRSSLLLGDVYLAEEEGVLLFGNARLKLAFSLTTGNWLGLHDPKKKLRGGGLQMVEVPSVLLRVGGRVKSTGVVRNSRVFELEGSRQIGAETRYLKHSAIALEREVLIEVTTQEGEWLLTSTFRLSPHSPTVARGLKISYLGTEKEILHDVRLIVPPIDLGETEEIWIEAPDYPVPSHYPLIDIPEGIWEGLDSRSHTKPGMVQHAVDAPGSIAGLVAFYNSKSKDGVLLWPHSTSEFSIMELEKDRHGPRLVQWMFLADRFANGHMLAAEGQYIRLDQGHWTEIMRRFQEWYEQADLTAPLKRPDWTGGVAIYEVHVGRAPFLGGREYGPYPEMADLVNDLPRIADLGFEVIQIMPHWPFCGYTVHDYYQIDKQYGDPSELKALTHLAHKLGLKVILDIVLHGCVDKEIIEWDMSMLDSRYDFIFSEWLQAADPRSRYRDEHPEWFMQDLKGETARIYTWAFDHASRSYQDFLIDVLRYYIRDLEVDGFRFDAPTWNCMPNWAPDRPHRASFAYYAAHHLMNRVRKEIKAENPDILLYTEPSGPLFRHTMDLTYNYDEEWISGSVLNVVSERGFAGARYYTGKKITAKTIAEWFHFQTLSLPAGSMTVHHLDSHDTFWWGELAQFRHEAFGVIPSRALFAMFALIGGGIMSYVGAEGGSEDFYGKLLRLRQSDQSLRYGTCDFLAVGCDDPMVLPLLRIHGREHSIPLVNLGDRDATIHLSLPIGQLGLDETKEYLVVDLFNLDTDRFQKRRRGEDLLDLQIDLSAYQVRVLRIYLLEK